MIITINSSCKHTNNLPKEKHESLYEGPEVVVLVDGTVSVFLKSNIPKQLLKYNNTVSTEI